MSRIGNSPIKVPEGVNINLQDKKIIVSGKLGSLEQDFKDVNINIEKNIITLSRIQKQMILNLNMVYTDL